MKRKIAFAAAAVSLFALVASPILGRLWYLWIMSTGIVGEGDGAEFVTSISGLIVGMILIVPACASVCMFIYGWFDKETK